MNIHSINFETWCSNHKDDHTAKWCRELYPWEVFQDIDYSKAKEGTLQEISSGRISYEAIVKSRKVDEKRGGRIVCLVHLRNPELNLSLRKQWQNRSWDHEFRLVASPEGYFITLYVVGDDPTETMLREFFEGDFPALENKRNLPLSGLMFRSLISYAALDMYPELEKAHSYTIKSVSQKGFHSGVRPLDAGGTFEPFLSQGRELWIGYSFTEEKAHRLALQLIGQCDRLIVVYSQPTFSKHHRAKGSAEIYSLSEFLRLASADIYRNYSEQARFLLNHLQGEPEDEAESARELYEKVLTLKGPMEILTSEVREAKAGLGIIVTNECEAAYVCACANLLNAALNRRSGLYLGGLELSNEVYSFKQIFGRKVEEMMLLQARGVSVYLAPDGLTYVSIGGVQFSYRQIPRTAKLKAFASTKMNTLQEWDGIRLQPIAPLVLAWARALMREDTRIMPPPDNLSILAT
jgi:hypothetical protein